MPDSAVDRNTLEALTSTTDRAFVIELIDTFLDDASSLLESLTTTLAENDTEGFRRAAHSLKSNAASLGALSLSESAKELEMMGKSDDLSSAGTKLEPLREEYARVVAALKEYQDEP
jgi:HPt (histidine-containing phosphotransfer) domain-containing protein